MPAALTNEQEDRVWMLHLQRVPQVQIAAQVGCSRPTVSNVVKRIREKLAEGRMEDLEQARAEAIAEYQAISREAWQRLAKCRATSPVAVGYIGALVDTRRQQDRLLGLEQITVNHRQVHLARIEHLMKTPVPVVLVEGDGDARPTLAGD